MDEYLRANRDLWDDLTPIHAASEFYNLSGFKRGECTLMALDRQEVGEVSGKSLLHLQCHFGLDTLSWTMLGVRVTGVDFSPRAIALAGSLAAELEIAAQFYCADLDHLPRCLSGDFDIVYTSGGVLPWLPDLISWAEVIAHFLHQRGFFYIREDHPVAGIFDDQRGASIPRVRYPYFHSKWPMQLEGQGSYAAPKADIHSVHYEWFHSLADVVNSLIEAGLRIEYLHEFPFASYRSLPFLIQGENGMWRYPHLAQGLPLTFSIRATKA